MQALESRPIQLAMRSPEASRAAALDALYATGHWLLSLGRIYDAASLFRGMAVLAPDDERAWLALGACHEAAKQVELALEIYGTGQVLTRPAVRTRLARARALSQLGRDDEARQARVEAWEVAGETGDESLIALATVEGGAP
jgi:Flp pilus assembly protein TadD